MSKSTNKDFNLIGDIYGNMLSQVQTIQEKVNEIGDAPLQAGGPLEKRGFTKKNIDLKTMSDKEKTDNLYNITKLSYEEDEEAKKCEHAAEGCDCDECDECKKNQKTKKSLGESRKIVKNSLNNFMSKKSVFEKLYENVMGGNFNPPGGGQSPDNEEADLDALGLDDASTDDEMGEDEGDTVTFTLDRATAQTLIDVLQGALGDMEGEMEDEGDMEDEGEGEDEGSENPFGEEDEEGPGAPAAFNTSYNDGKNNKVGSLKTSKGAASFKYTDKVGQDGDYGHAGVNATYRDGKSNKVGGLKTGKSLFEQ